jgi:hypothetical protein
VLEQVVRELPDREDVDEVEEQLERGDDALGTGRPASAAEVASTYHRIQTAAVSANTLDAFTASDRIQP